MIWVLAAVTGAAFLLIVAAAVRLDRRRRELGLGEGPGRLPDRFLSNEIDHQLPGILNWTHREGTFQARRRVEDSW
ncbi:MAG: hypothetical protein V9G19_17630 [Tetrasphaera sp.]